MCIQDPFELDRNTTVNVRDCGFGLFKEQIVKARVVIGSSFWSKKSDRTEGWGIGALLNTFLTLETATSMLGQALGLA